MSLKMQVFIFFHMKKKNKLIIIYVQIFFFLNWSHIIEKSVKKNISWYIFFIRKNYIYYKRKNT